MVPFSASSLDDFPAFLARFPADLDFEALARRTKAFRRARGVRSGTGLLRLVLAWGVGGHSTQHVASWAGEQGAGEQGAGEQGIASLSEEALTQRPHGAGPFLEAISQRLLAGGKEKPCAGMAGCRVSLTAPA